MTVQSVKERELPDADDDFAQLASEFDTLDELRADLRDAGRAGQGAASRASRPATRCWSKLLEAADIPVPTALVEAEVHRHLEGEDRLEDDEHRAEVGESATQGACRPRSCSTRSPSRRRSRSASPS